MAKGKGIVISHPTLTHKGKVSVVTADKYDFGEGKYPAIDYENKSGGELQIDDTVELNMISATQCDITKKYVASQGIVTNDPGGWMISISSLESNNFGRKLGDKIFFRLHPDPNDQYPGKDSPSPANPGDTVEVLIISSGSVFVKVLKAAK
ncbi:MAG: hypothetical protein QM737_15070 [Ferruginibacter sp.]